MILDGLIALIASIAAIIAEAVLALVLPVANLAAAAVEGIAALFGATLQLGRMDRRKRKVSISPLIPTITVVAAFGGWLGWMKLMHRDLTLVAEDGHSLPFAAVVIHKGDENIHRRTDHSGNMTIPRFGVAGVTLKDPRYVTETWKDPHVPQTLIARRTVLGGGLDKVANRLLEPVKR